MIYFSIGILSLLGIWGIWIALLYEDEKKKLSEKYTDTRPFNEDNPEETKQEVEHKQKIRIE